MICPSCSHHNLPGWTNAPRCMFDLASLDQPAAHDRVEASVMSDSVWQLNPKQPLTVSVNALLGDALQSMVDQEIGAIIVTDEQQNMAGILTERDFLMKVVGVIPDFSRQPLRPVMTTDPETVAPTERWPLHCKRWTSAAIDICRSSRKANRSASSRFVT